MGVVKEFAENWRSFEGSTAEKIRVALRNRARAATRGCCGNHGQPGC